MRKAAPELMVYLNTAGLDQDIRYKLHHQKGSQPFI